MTIGTGPRPYHRAVEAAYDATRAPRLRQTSAWIGLSALFVFFVLLVVQMIAYGLGGTGVNFIGIAVIYAPIACIVSLSVSVAAASPASVSRSAFLVRIAMTALAILAPVAAVLLLRLSMEICIILNPLGLPWPTSTKTVVRIACATVVIASTAAIFLTRKHAELRGTSRVLAIYSAIMLIPGFFAFFLMVYGDPFGGCVPG